MELFIKYMMDLNLKVFGDIALKEIFGSQPPLEPDMKEKMESEFKLLLKKLEGKKESDLGDLLLKQKELQKIVNSKPGSMALPQSKISLFIEYSQKYIQAIERRSLSLSNNHVH